jgi:hypothetical protein
VTYLSGRFWDSAPRYCEQHHDKAPVKGGEYRKTDKAHQVWVCAKCIEREKERGSVRTTDGA